MAGKDNDDLNTVYTPKEQIVEMIDRDPEHLHDEMKVRFHDVFGEPDKGIHSFECVWETSFALFMNTKLWCYRILSLICGLPLAIYWGCHFAMISFYAIWCWVPYMKAFAIEMRFVRGIYKTLLDVFIRPCFEAASYCCYNIRIQKV